MLDVVVSAVGLLATAWVQFPVLVANPLYSKIVLDRQGVTLVDLVTSITLQGSSFSMCSHKPVLIHRDKCKFEFEFLIGRSSKSTPDYSIGTGRQNVIKILSEFQNCQTNECKHVERMVKYYLETTILATCLNISQIPKLLPYAI